MPKTKISEYSTTNSQNTDINSINIDEGCPPSSINNAIREVMVHLKNFQTGASGDPFTFAGAVTFTNTAAFSSIADSGNLNFTGTGNRITGDFSNATASSRVALQSSTTNGNTIFGVLPNGTSNTSVVTLESDSANTTGSNLTINMIGGSEARIASGIRGAGTYLPMTFYTGNSERVRIDTSGNVGIGTSSPGAKLHVIGDVLVNSQVIQSGAGTSTISYTFGGQTTKTGMGCPADGTLAFYAGTTTERARIDSSGNVGVGTSSPTEKLDVTGNVKVSGNITAANFYPVGSIYINATNSTNPATLLGFGTWVAFGSGRVMVGFNASDPLFDTAEETGGSKDAIVVAHDHGFSATTSSDGAHTHSISQIRWSNTNGFNNNNGGGSGTTNQFIPNTDSAGAHTHSVSGTTASTGSSGTNANLQPYITVYMWKRTA